MVERRLMQRVFVAVCEGGRVVGAAGPGDWAWQVECPRGHWSWMDGNYCGTCGAAMKGVP